MKFTQFQVKIQKFLKEYLLKIAKIILYPFDKFSTYQDNKNTKRTVTDKQLKKAVKLTVKHYYKRKYKIYLNRPNAYMTSYFSHKCHGYDYDYVLSTKLDFIPYKIRNKFKLWRLNDEQASNLDKLLAKEFRSIGFEVNEMKSDDDKYIYYQVNPKFE